MLEIHQHRSSLGLNSSPLHEERWIEDQGPPHLPRPALDSFQAFRILLEVQSPKTGHRPPLPGASKTSAWKACPHRPLMVGTRSLGLSPHSQVALVHQQTAERLIKDPSTFTALFYKEVKGLGQGHPGSQCQSPDLHCSLPGVAMALVAGVCKCPAFDSHSRCSREGGRSLLFQLSMWGLKRDFLRVSARALPAPPSQKSNSNPALCLLDSVSHCRSEPCLGPGVWTGRLTSVQDCEGNQAVATGMETFAPSELSARARRQGCFRASKESPGPFMSSVPRPKPPANGKYLHSQLFASERGRGEMLMTFHCHNRALCVTFSTALPASWAGSGARVSAGVYQDLRLPRGKGKESTKKRRRKAGGHSVQRLLAGLCGC